MQNRTLFSLSENINIYLKKKQTIDKVIIFGNNSKCCLEKIDYAVV